ncbi:hypothetical protein K3495_g12028 [Podosphaera aphanis]|nr:hypothetical protein K3495_g12028 [Podosphaera aphanis]
MIVNKSGPHIKHRNEDCTEGTPYLMDDKQAYTPALRWFQEKTSIGTRFDRLTESAQASLNTLRLRSRIYSQSSTVVVV